MATEWTVEQAHDWTRLLCQDWMEFIDQCGGYVGGPVINLHGFHWQGGQIALAEFNETRAMHSEEFDIGARKAFARAYPQLQAKPRYKGITATSWHALAREFIESSYRLLARACGASDEVSPEELRENWNKAVLFACTVPYGWWRLEDLLVALDGEYLEVLPGDVGGTRYRQNPEGDAAAEPAQGADIRADNLKKYPRDKDTLDLCVRLAQPRSEGESEDDIALEFFGGNVQKAQSKLRNARRYPHIYK